MYYVKVILSVMSVVNRKMKPSCIFLGFFLLHYCCAFSDGAFVSENLEADVKTLVEIYNVNYQYSNAVYFLINSNFNRAILDAFFSQIQIYPKYMFNEKYRSIDSESSTYNYPIILDNHVNVFCFASNFGDIMPAVKVQLQPLIFNHRSNFTIAIINMQLKAADLNVALKTFFLDFVRNNIFNVIVYVRGADFENVFSYNYFLDELIDLTSR